MNIWGSIWSISIRYYSHNLFSNSSHENYCEISFVFRCKRTPLIPIIGDEALSAMEADDGTAKYLLRHGRTISKNTTGMHRPENIEIFWSKNKFNVKASNFNLREFRRILALLDRFYNYIDN